jgi:hypothetical protein
MRFVARVDLVAAGEDEGVVEGVGERARGANEAEQDGHAGVEAAPDAAPLRAGAQGEGVAPEARGIGEPLPGREPLAADPLEHVGLPQDELVMQRLARLRFGQAGRDRAFGKEPVERDPAHPGGQPAGRRHGRVEPEPAARAVENVVERQSVPRRPELGGAHSSPQAGVEQRTLRSGETRPREAACGARGENAMPSMTDRRAGTTAIYHSGIAKRNECGPVAAQVVAATAVARSPEIGPIAMRAPGKKTAAAGTQAERGRGPAGAGLLLC